MEYKNLFDQKTYDHFTSRVDKLNYKTPALWGKMNVAQMLTHCQKPFLIANGSLNSKPNRVVKFLFGKLAKRQVFSGKPFRKSLPTFPEATIIDERDFEKEKMELKNIIHNFHKNGEAGVTKNHHPLFGELSSEEWNVLLTLHLDHHLRQFGV